SSRGLLPLARVAEVAPRAVAAEASAHVRTHVPTVLAQLPAEGAELLAGRMEGAVMVRRGGGERRPQRRAVMAGERREAHADRLERVGVGVAHASEAVLLGEAAHAT